jgi:hypothetical protein
MFTNGLLVMDAYANAGEWQMIGRQAHVSCQTDYASSSHRLHRVRIGLLPR